LYVGLFRNLRASLGKNRNKKRTAKNLFGPAGNTLLVLKVYITILHLVYQLSMYKLTVLRVAVETTSTTPLPYLNSLGREWSIIFLLLRSLRFS
jgi:hypothetical protein